MAKVRNNFLDYVVYLLARVVVATLYMFPIRANYLTARLAAGLFWRLASKRRRQSMEHIRASFPDWSEDEVQRVAQQSLYGFAYMAMEVLFTPRLITPARWRRHIELINCAELIRMLLENERGIIFVTGHFGNFEIVGYTMATLGFPSVAVARPLDNPYINDWIMGVREKTGQSILYKKGATESMDDILERRGSLSFIADQDAGRKGAFVDFFGRPASTFKTPALMAMQHNVPIVVGFGRRLGLDCRFEIAVESIIRPADWADKSDPMLWITQEYTRNIEQIVRRTPEQYLWLHRRWKHQPKQGS